MASPCSEFDAVTGLVTGFQSYMVTIRHELDSVALRSKCSKDWIHSRIGQGGGTWECRRVAVRDAEAAGSNPVAPIHLA